MVTKESDEGLRPRLFTIVEFAEASFIDHRRTKKAAVTGYKQCAFLDQDEKKDGKDLMGRSQGRKHNACNVQDNIRIRGKRNHLKQGY